MPAAAASKAQASASPEADISLDMISCSSFAWIRLAEADSTCKTTQRSSCCRSSTFGLLSWHAACCQRACCGASSSGSCDRAIHIPPCCFGTVMLTMSGKQGGFWLCMACSQPPLGWVSCRGSHASEAQEVYRRNLNATWRGQAMDSPQHPTQLGSVVYP